MVLDSASDGKAGPRAPAGAVDRRRFLAAAGASVGLAGLGLAPGPVSGQQPSSRPRSGESPGPGRERDGENRPRKIRIAPIALATVDGMVEHNYARAVRMVEISFQHRPDLVLLPEAFAAGYCGRPLAECAEEGPMSRRLAPFAQLSARGRCMIVVGYLESVKGDRRVRNAVAIFDGGRLVGTHYKRDLFADSRRAYRDEPSLMIPGRQVETFATRLGRFAVLTCYENYVRANWDALEGKVDFVLSPYNCEHDPAENNLAQAQRTGIASAWADRTGTVFCGDGYTTNRGSAGLVDADGTVLAHSPAGAEVIEVGELTVGRHGGGDRTA